MISWVIRTNVTKKSSNSILCHMSIYVIPVCHTRDMVSLYPKLLQISTTGPQTKDALKSKRDPKGSTITNIHYTWIHSFLQTFHGSPHISTHLNPLHLNFHIYPHRDLLRSFSEFLSNSCGFCTSPLLCLHKVEEAELKQPQSPDRLLDHVENIREAPGEALLRLSLGKGWCKGPNAWWKFCEYPKNQK